MYLGQGIRAGQSSGRAEVTEGLYPAAGSIIEGDKFVGQLFLG